MKPDKDQLVYWWGRIRHPSNVSYKGRYQQKSWAVELHYNGKHLNWSLGTNNRELAAAKAREMYRYLMIHGWRAHKRKYRP